MEEISIPKNREESLIILREYKNQLSYKAFMDIHNIICDFAIENMFLDRQDIERNIKLVSGEITLDESIKQTIESFKINQSKAL
ncbi:MAG: hypothetical protein LBG21_06880 [Campylobacteraceae bacterium]|jgi:hypothetical protein|nr:hypothetical protein [Campylobacteraceae bacterium]